MNKLIEFLQRILEWFVELLLWIPRKIWEGLLDALAALIEGIPVPSFMSQLGNFAANIDSSVAYFASALQLGTGISFVLSAYVIRFIIRRIPVVG